MGLGRILVAKAVLMTIAFGNNLANTVAHLALTSN